MAGVAASMEPGREDREHAKIAGTQEPAAEPQWNPVAKTGSTKNPPAAGGLSTHASMEPGREDREHLLGAGVAEARHVRLNGTRSRRPGAPLAQITGFDLPEFRRLREVPSNTSLLAQIFTSEVLKERTDQHASSPLGCCRQVTTRKPLI